MKIELDDERGVYLCAVDAPRMTPWPDVVTLAGVSYRYYEALPSRVIYRRCFAVDLSGFVAGPCPDPRVERA